METHRQLKPEVSRMDALTDGVFAIVATLLVLDVKLPNIPEHHTQRELMESLAKVVPSFIAFAFSFMTVIIYWINHEHITQWVSHQDHPSKYLNLVFLFWLCLVPFPTRFISEYPMETVSVLTYGLEMFMVAATANLLYWYIAFRGKLLKSSVTATARKKYFNRAISGPITYFIAMIVSFVDVRIAMGIYILIPLLYVVMPKAELS